MTSWAYHLSTNTHPPHWIGDCGEFQIPPDVPIIFRKDGWFDKRRKISRQLAAYFKAMDDRMGRGERILTWAEFTKQ